MKSRMQMTVATASALGAAMALHACGNDDGGGATLRPNVVLVDRTTQPLSVGEIVTINGTYGANCDGRTENAAWVLAVGGGAGGVTSNLSILQGDTDCTISVTGLTATIDSATVTYTAATAIVLATPADQAAQDYDPGNVRAFSSGTSVGFYGNARRQQSGGALTIHFAFSNDPTFSSEEPVEVGPAATFTVTGTGDPIPAPNYTLAAPGDGVPLGFEYNGGEFAVTGSSVLTGTLTGGLVFDGYVVTLDELDNESSFEEVHTAYTGGTAEDDAAEPITGTLLTGLLAEEEPGAVVSIIVRAEHTDSGVYTYQVFQLRFGTESGDNEPLNCVVPSQVPNGDNSACICAPEYTDVNDDPNTLDCQQNVVCTGDNQVRDEDTNTCVCAQDYVDVDTGAGLDCEEAAVCPGANTQIVNNQCECEENYTPTAESGTGEELVCEII